MALKFVPLFKIQKQRDDIAGNLLPELLSYYSRDNDFTPVSTVTAQNCLYCEV